MMTSSFLRQRQRQQQQRQQQQQQSSNYYNNNMILFVVTILFLLTSNSCSAIELSSSRQQQHYCFWGIPRGGGEESNSNNNNNNNKFITYGIIYSSSLQNNNDSSSFAILDTGKEMYSFTNNQNNNNNDTNSWIETLSILSDVLIYVADDDSNENDGKLLQLDNDSIYRGMKRRKDAGYSKPLIAIIVKEQQQQQQQNQIVLEDSLRLNDFVQSVQSIKKGNDIIMIEETPNDNSLIIGDKESYEVLVQQVYNSLSSTDNNNTKCSIKVHLQEEKTIQEFLDKNIFDNGNNNNNKPEGEKIIHEKKNNNDLLQKEEEEEEEQQQQQKKNDDDKNSNIINSGNTIMQELLDLETKQQEIWLQHNDNDNNDSPIPPLLQFGSLLNSITKKLDGDTQIRYSVLPKLEELYQNQLQSLRDYFGTKYDTILDSTEEETWSEHAKLIMEEFRTAAKNAIPSIALDISENYFSYMTQFQGLVSDMMEATSMMSTIEEDPPLEADEEEEVQPKAKPKWYKKVAAKAIMLGVNYIQGYIAWQGVKKAAEKRDRDMPKFPLF